MRGDVRKYRLGFLKISKHRITENGIAITRLITRIASRPSGPALCFYAGAATEICFIHYLRMTL